MKRDRSFWVILGLAVFAFGFKLYLLSQRSLYIDPDEGYYLLLARNLAAGRGYALNGLPNIIFPPLLPALIALFQAVLRDGQLALSLINALAGSGLGVIIYLLARKMGLSGGVSAAAGFVALFIYPLNAFLPVSARYVQMLYRGSDILNGCLIMASIYFAILLAEKGRLRWALAAAATLALAYLTRPEALLLFLVVVGFLAGLKLLSRIGPSWKAILAFLIAFLILITGYVLYLKTTTGQWQLSGKIAASQKYRDALLEVIRNENWSPFNKIHYALKADGSEMEDPYFGFYKEPAAGEAMDPRGLLRNVQGNLRSYGIIPQVLMPLYLLPFCVIGLLGALWRLFKKGPAFDFLVLAAIPYSLAVEALSYPIPRHHLFLVPVFILYSAAGASFLASVVSHGNEESRKKVLVLIVGIWASFITYEHIMKSTRQLLSIPQFRAARESEVVLGRMLARKGAAVIMSSHPVFAVRAGSDWQVLPDAPIPDVVRFGKRKNVDYAVVRGERGIPYRLIDIKASEEVTAAASAITFNLLEKGAFFEIVKAAKSR